MQSVPRPINIIFICLVMTLSSKELSGTKKYFSCIVTTLLWKMQCDWLKLVTWLAIANISDQIYSEIFLWVCYNAIAAVMQKLILTYLATYLAMIFCYTVSTCKKCLSSSSTKSWLKILKSNLKIERGCFNEMKLSVTNWLPYPSSKLHK